MNGLDTIQTLFGANTRASVERLAVESPLSAHAAAQAVGAIFGDDHHVLPLKLRELITVAVLAARGDAAPQLRVHLRGATTAGASRAEIMAVLDQLHPYTGLPTALNAITIARTWFDEQTQQEP